VRTKVKTPGAGKNMVEEAVQLLPWTGCANCIISQSRVHAWSPTMFYIYLHLNKYILFKQFEKKIIWGLK
jgi:hypothetical protein